LKNLIDFPELGLTGLGNSDLAIGFDLSNWELGLGKETRAVD
jgi:hypothetical protein